MAGGMHARLCTRTVSTFFIFFLQKCQHYDLHQSSANRHLHVRHVQNFAKKKAPSQSLPKIDIGVFVHTVLTWSAIHLQYSLSLFHLFSKMFSRGRNSPPQPLSMSSEPRFGVYLMGHCTICYMHSKNTYSAIWLMHSDSLQDASIYNNVSCSNHTNAITEDAIVKQISFRKKKVHTFFFQLVVEA